MFTKLLRHANMAMMVMAAVWSGYYLGTMALPPSGPSAEQVRVEAIRRCFLDTSGRLNRTHPDPEVLASINEQCRRLYDER